MSKLDREAKTVPVTDETTSELEGRTEEWTDEGKITGRFPKPPVEHRDTPSILDRLRLALRTKTRKAMAITALAGVIAGGVTVAHQLGGSSERALAKSDKNTSAPAAPTVEDNIPASVELPNNVITMDVEPDAGQQQASFDAAFSPLITERVDNGNLGDNSNDDLSGLTGGDRVNGLVALAHGASASLSDAREKLTDTKYADSGLSIVSDVVRTNLNENDGSFTTVADLEYFLVDKDGVPVGHTQDNKERFGFTYEKRKIQFEDGTTKIVEVLTDVEGMNGNNDK